jgi:hypothetical protein
MFVTDRRTDEHVVYEFKPGKVRTSQAAIVERMYAKLSGEKQTWESFKIGVLQGSATARRVLLWHLMLRDHPTTRIDDVDPTEDELLVEHSKSELQEMRDALEKAAGPSESEMGLMLARLDVEIMTAREDGGGKAPSTPSENATG